MTDILLSLFVFACFVSGTYNLLTSKNIIRIIVSIEALLNGFVLSIVVVGIQTKLIYDSALFASTVIVLTTVEIAVLTAALVLLYHRKHSIMVEDLKEIKG